MMRMDAVMFFLRIVEEVSLVRANYRLDIMNIFEWIIAKVVNTEDPSCGFCTYII